MSVAAWVWSSKAKLKSAGAWRPSGTFARLGAVAVAILGSAVASFAQESGGGEANLKLPDLSQVNFLGMDGHKLLMFGLVFCVFGLLFGLTIYTRLKNMPVHRSMREISELIYETCKT